jgi:hypothetical protein
MTNPDPETHDATFPERAGQRCRVRVGSADGLLAIVPFLLGFHPSDSLVVLGIGGPHARVRLAFRYDLPDPPEEEIASDIAAHAASVLDRQDLTTAVAIGYGEGRLVTPVVDGLLPVLREAGIKVHDALRVLDGRYWSYVCRDPRCCPPDGVPFDPSEHPAAVALAAAGLSARQDRAELASVLEPAADATDAMDQALLRAQGRVASLVSGGLAGGGGDPLQPVADAARRSVRLAVAGCRRGEQLSDDDIAWLGLTLTDLRVRDDAWARMDPEFNQAHQKMWTDLVRRLPADLTAAPAALLAFTAWQAGNGALASVAIERALGVDPGYSMALLIADALYAGLPPSAARLPMTPKQVAASYARRRTSATDEGSGPAAGSRRTRAAAVRKKRQRRQARVARRVTRSQAPGAAAR